MDKKNWLVLPQDATPIKRQDTQTKLMEMMNQLEDERGYRFTDEQAETIKKLITNLINQIKSYKNEKKR